VGPASAASLAPAQGRRKKDFHYAPRPGSSARTAPTRVAALRSINIGPFIKTNNCK